MHFLSIDYKYTISHVRNIVEYAIINNIQLFMPPFLLEVNQFPGVK